MKFSNRPKFAKNAFPRVARLGLLLTGLATAGVTARAQTTATWSATPGSAAWSEGASENWVGGVGPFQSGDSAIFGASSVSEISFGGSAQLDSLTFTAEAPAYRFHLGNDNSFSLTGAGIVNQSGFAPEFFIHSNPYAGSPTGLAFGGNARAGNAIFRVLESADMRVGGSANLEDSTLVFSKNSYVSAHEQATFGASSVTLEEFANLRLSAEASLGSASVENHGSIVFNSRATAGNSSITNEGSISFGGESTAGLATINSNGGTITFEENSTAANSRLTVQGGVLKFLDQAVGGFSTIIAESGGEVEFRGNSDAQYALVTVRSGSTVKYFDQTSASGSNVTVEAGGRFDMSGFAGSELQVASIAGAGEFILGTFGTGDVRPLIVGGYGADAEVSGTIVNGFAGRGGGLVKVGGGTLTLSGSEANTFYGGLTVNRGTVVLAKSPGVVSAGNGPVTIEPNGTLRFAADHQVSLNTEFTLAGGLLQTGGYSATIGSLMLTANSRLDFGAGLSPSTISFTDSSGNDWLPGAMLTVLNYQVGFTNLRFGSSDLGLTSAQLGQIYFQGYGAGAARIDLNGYVLPVSAIPEPSTYAALAGAVALGLAIIRRRRSN